MLSLFIIVWVIISNGTFKYLKKKKKNLKNEKNEKISIDENEKEEEEG